MTDIVERLRAHADQLDWTGAETAAREREAAAEIERLQARLYEVDAQLTSEGHIHARECMALRAEKDAEIERLRAFFNEAITTLEKRNAEIGRLRAVLQRLTSDPPRSLAREPDTDCEVILKMREIARAALEPKP